jgi:hypothetical protein
VLSHCEASQNYRSRCAAKIISGCDSGSDWADSIAFAHRTSIVIKVGSPPRHATAKQETGLVEALQAALQTTRQ